MNINEELNRRLAVLRGMTEGPWHVGPDWDRSIPQQLVYPPRTYADGRLVECVKQWGGFEIPNAKGIAESRNLRENELLAILRMREALKLIAEENADNPVGIAAVALRDVDALIGGTLND